MSDDAFGYALEWRRLFEQRACRVLDSGGKGGADLRRCEEGQPQEAGEECVFHVCVFISCERIYENSPSLPK